MKSVLFKHRSIRKFRPEPIPEEVLRECLEAASRASTCGNMQLYSLVVTRDAALRERLSPCHFDQPMVREAPCVVTVCADVHRFTMWCEQRDADPAYDNFAWFLNASTDALLAAQNFCVAAESHGLGICYLGTTIYTAAEISRVLSLPKGVIPVTTVVTGYPDESPELTDRLPLEAVVHYEKYTDYTAAEIDAVRRERDAAHEAYQGMRAEVERIAGRLKAYNDETAAIEEAEAIISRASSARRRVQEIDTQIAALEEQIRAADAAAVRPALPDDVQIITETTAKTTGRISSTCTLTYKGVPLKSVNRAKRVEICVRILETARVMTDTVDKIPIIIDNAESVQGLDDVRNVIRFTVGE